MHIGYFYSFAALLESTLRSLVKRFVMKESLKQSEKDKKLQKPMSEAMAARAEQKQKADMLESVKATICKCEEIAFENIVENRRVFNMDQSLAKHNDANLMRMGLLEEIPCNDVTPTDDVTATAAAFKFTSTLFQDFLAARFIATINKHDVMRYVEQLTRDTHMQQVLLFYCAMTAEDGHDVTVEGIFRELCDDDVDAKSTHSTVSSQSRSSSRPEVGKMDENEEKELGDKIVSLKNNCCKSVALDV